MVANMSRAYEATMTELLGFASTQGELGMVAQLEGLNWPRSLEPLLQRTTAALNGTYRIPRSALPTRRYLGTPRVFLMPARTLRLTVERAPFKIRAVALADETLTPLPPSAVLSHRPLGAGSWQTAAMGRVTPGRGWYEAELPLQDVAEDFEYTVKLTLGDGSTLVFPPEGAVVVLVAGPVPGPSPVAAVGDRNRA